MYVYMYRYQNAHFLTSSFLHRSTPTSKTSVAKATDCRGAHLLHRRHSQTGEFRAICFQTRFAHVIICHSAMQSSS